MNTLLNNEEGLGQIMIPITSTVSTAGGGGSTLATSAIAGPIGLAIGAAVTALQIWWSRSRLAGQRRITATEIVNQVEPVLQQNMAEYLGRSDRSKSLQAEALNNFDVMWQVVVEACGVSELGQAGRRCISDRQRGGQFKWFERYRDPIARDSTGVVSSVVASILPQPLQELVSEVPWALVLGIGLIGVVFLMGRK